MKRAAVLASLLAAGQPAQAAFLAGEALDTAADILAWVILIVVPIVAIVLFWLVHILPEQIAERRHHPQQDAIKTLCILSLFFGGMLWPFAWLWAYTRPTFYRQAYGTDKHETWFEEMAAKARAGASTAEEVRHLREELKAMEARGALPAAMQGLLGELEALSQQAQGTGQGSSTPPAGGR